MLLSLFDWVRATMGKRATAASQSIAKIVATAKCFMVGLLHVLLANKGTSSPFSEYWIVKEVARGLSKICAPAEPTVSSGPPSRL